jgi:hypothetical protein
MGLPGLGNLPIPGQPGGQAGGDMTANKFFDRDRYLYVTDQSRHLPVAVTLTMDQSHLSEVLVAFANSRLRFQTTQVEFRRVPSAAPSAAPAGQPGMPEYRPKYPGSPPDVGDSRPMGRPLPGPLTPSVGAGTTPPGGPPEHGGLFTPPTFPGGPNTGQPPAAAPPTENNNLVEVTIYGIASLYERPR